MFSNTKTMKKLYLDIDGVLVTAKNTRAADGVISFLQFITSNFDCYWLTTHCKGDSEYAINYVREFVPDRDNLLPKIKPTNWNTLKTEAIDFDSEFFWLDDYPMMAEILVLKQHEKESNLIVVELNRHNELNTILDYLSRQL